MRRLLAFFFGCGEYGHVTDVALDILIGPCERRMRHRGPHRAMGYEWAP